MPAAALNLVEPPYGIELQGIPWGDGSSIQQGFNMATIKKRLWTSPSGEPREAWQVFFVDKAGKRRHKQFRLKKDADAWLVKARNEVREGTFVAEGDSPTVIEAIDAGLRAARRKAGNARPSASADSTRRISSLCSTLTPGSRTSACPGLKRRATTCCYSIRR